MLKKRLISCLLWREGTLVQSRQFQHTNSVGDALTAVDFFNTWAIDEIVLLDVSRTPKHRALFHEHLRELSERCFVPLAVGGWVTTLAEIRQLLSEGADKVVVNTAAVRDPNFITMASESFGAQCIVVSIDAKKNTTGEYEVFVNRGKDAAGMRPDQLAKVSEERGAGEVFITSIDHDGRQAGYDMELVRLVRQATSVPVVASGGVGEWSHLAEAIIEGGADAVSAANIFHYSDQSTKKAKDYLKLVGIDVREPEFYKILLPRKPVYRV